MVKITHQKGRKLSLVYIKTTLGKDSYVWLGGEKALIGYQWRKLTESAKAEIMQQKKVV
jgi:hypothetical protein